jgi:GNAT superfamily N-acetyltransferase
MDVRFVTLSDFTPLQDLFAASLGATKPLDKVAWKYLQSNHGSNNLPHGVAAYDGTQLVGWSGFFYQPLTNHGVIIPAVQVGDVCVHPAYQNQGVSVALANYFAANLGQYGDLAFGFTGTATLFNGSTIQPLATTESYSATAGDLQGLTLPAGYQYSNTIPDAANLSLLLNAENATTLGTYKDADYIAWRYQNLADRSYVFSSVTMVGMLAGFAAGMVDGDSTFMIHDVIATDLIAADAALKNLVISAGNQSSYAFWCTSGFPWKAEFVTCGFTKDQSCQMNAVTIPLTQDPTVLSLIGSAEWSLTRGDADY